MIDTRYSSKAMLEPKDQVRYLLSKNFTNQEIAELIGSNPNSVSNWKNGHNKPNHRYTHRLWIVRIMVDILLDDLRHDPDDLFFWFGRSNPAFKDQTPREAIKRYDPSEVINRMQNWYHYD